MLIEHHPNILTRVLYTLMLLVLPILVFLSPSFSSCVRLLPPSGFIFPLPWLHFGRVAIFLPVMIFLGQRPKCAAPGPVRAAQVFLHRRQLLWFGFYARTVFLWSVSRSRVQFSFIGQRVTRPAGHCLFDLSAPATSPVVWLHQLLGGSGLAARWLQSACPGDFPDCRGLLQIEVSIVLESSVQKTRDFLV
jgi:hypothetical protein